MVSSSRYRLAVLSFIWLVGAFLVFVLPWHIPQNSPLLSDSYILGFSNKTAILGLGATLMALFLCFVGFQKSGENYSINGRFARLLHPSRVTKAEYFFLLGFSALYCCALWLWFRLLPDNHFGEIVYPVCRLELILLGKAPYLDFEWTYGPFFLYFPALLVKLSNYRLSTDFAYFLSLAVCSSLGFAGVYYVLAQFRLWRWQRILIFLAVTPTLNVGLGVNTTLLRFIFAFAALFFINNQASKITDKKPQQLGLLLKTIIAIGLCFCLSPEVGLVFCMGLLVFCITKIRRGERWYLGFIIICLCMVVSVAFSSSFFRSAAAFASGGSNFPVVPSAQILLFLFSICFIVPPLLAYGWRAHHKSAPIAIGIGAMIIPYSVAALGRCDVTHVFNNGLGLYLFALAFWMRYRPKFHFYAVLFTLFFTVSYPLCYYFAYSATMADALAQRARGVVKAERTFMSAAPVITDPSLLDLQAKLRPLHRVGMPLNADDDIELLLKRDGLYCFEFFPMPGLEVRSPEQLKGKLADVQKMPYIIVDKRALYPEPYNEAQYAAEQQRYLTQNMLYLVDYKIKNKPFLPKNEVAKYIRLHFTPISTYKTYVIMKNKSVK